jgi:pimeloyl-ACP methyl ester carboxylesterase
MSDAGRSLLFLPGAGGDARFWHPVGELLPAAWRKTYLAWPGLGAEPHDPDVRGIDDLVRLAAAKLKVPSTVLAQSMGGIVAIRLALAHPDLVTHLVLTATSGGVDVARLGAADWRENYRREYPQAAEWITRVRADHLPELARIAQPTLLIWGDADPISPLAVGRQLATLLPKAELAIVPGGDHAFARDRATVVAPLIERHITL